MECCLECYLECDMDRAMMVVALRLPRFGLPLTSIHWLGRGRPGIAVSVLASYAEFYLIGCNSELPG
jgi:hypothetical protein